MSKQLPINGLFDDDGSFIGVATGNTEHFTVGDTFPISNHYKIATFGDSRSNTGATHLTNTSGSVLASEKVASVLCQLRGDLRIVFNGGVSGGLAANWDNDSDTPTGRITAGKGIASLLLTQPDIVFIQFGINDILLWNGSTPTKEVFTANLISSLQNACATIMGSGVPIVFESINPAAPSSVSYISGYTASGGFGNFAPEKLQILQEVNSAMSLWISKYPKRARYVDTSSVTTGRDGYAKTDGTYYDGTHMSMVGTFKAAGIILSEIADFIPRRDNISLPTKSRNAVNGFLTGVVAGKATGWGVSSDTGTWLTESWSVEGQSQVVNLTCTALAGGFARRIVTVAPSFVGASTLPVLAAGNILQARIEYEIDDGFGGDPPAYFVMLRGRVFYNDSTNEFTVHGQPSNIASTDHPAMTAHSGCLMTPGLAVKAAMSNSTILNTTQLQIMVACNKVGTIRLKIKNAEWRVVG